MCVHAGASTKVLGGVGWGLAASSAAASSLSPHVMPRSKQQAAAAQAEMQKKQSLWKVRKTFGLEPAPQHDSSAQVVECGAGAWQ